MVAGDVARVAAIEAEAFTSPWKENTFRSLLARPGVDLWVLDAPDAGVVGYAVLWCVLDQGELANIAVTTSHRGRGLGGRLLGMMLELAKKRGVETIYLEVRVSNQRAADMYRRFGFEEIGSRKGYYDHPKEDAILMRMRL